MPLPVISEKNFKDLFPEIDSAAEIGGGGKKLVFRVLREGTPPHLSIHCISLEGVTRQRELHHVRRVAILHDLSLPLSAENSLIDSPSVDRQGVFRRLSGVE